MAPQHTDPPVVVDSDDSEESSPEPMSLEGAINSATRSILINTLLEVCNQSDASKDIVKAMLLPSPTTPGPTDSPHHGRNEKHYRQIPLTGSASTAAVSSLVAQSSREIAYIIPVSSESRR
jgi:hypothetical protein